MKKHTKYIIGICMAMLMIINTMLSVPVTTQAAGTKPTSLKLSSSKSEMYVGQKMTLKVKKVTPKSASKQVKWSTSNKRIATVSSKGKVTAKKAGTVKITAKSKFNSKVKAVCKITVKEKAKKITLNTTKKTLKVGESFTLKVKSVTPKKAFIGVKYNSSKNDVASVNEKGKVTGKKVGITTITVTSKSNSKVKTTCKVTVEENVAKTPTAEPTKNATATIAPTKVATATIEPTKAQKPTEVPTTELAPETTKVPNVIEQPSITWNMDDDGNLVAKGYGEVCEWTLGLYDVLPLWYLRCEKIKNAKLEVNGCTDLSALFQGCNNLQTVDISKLDTSKVTSMENMFVECSSLTEIDVSNFDTSELNDIYDMFYGCSSLKNIDLSNFDMCKIEMTPYRSNVYIGNNIRLLTGCSSLEQIKTPRNINEAIKIELPGVYQDANGKKYAYLPIQKAESIELVRVNVQADNIEWNVDDNGCLTVIGTGELFKWDEGRYLPLWWKESANIKSAKLQVSDCIRLDGLFEDCTALQELDLSQLDTSQVVNMDRMFEGCTSLKSIDLSNLNTSQVISMDRMFSGCSSLTSIDLTNLDTGQVISMDRMFSGCSNLVSINMANLDTSKVMGMYGMFEGCSSLNTLDMSQCNIGNVENIVYIFSQCEKLENIRIPINLKLEIPLFGFYSDTIGKRYTIMPKCQETIELKKYNNESGIVWNIDDNGCLRVTGEGELIKGESFETYEPTYKALWSERKDEIKNAKIEVAGCTSLENLFEGCTNLQKVDVAGLNTSEVTNMSNMFSGCTSLNNLNVEKWNTSEVVDMSSMFAKCSSLTSLNVENWDTSKVKYLDGMFNGCSALTNLDVSNWKTPNIINTGCMFAGCSGLTNLDISKWDMSKVYNLNDMFCKCSNLKSLNVSTWNTSNVFNMYSVFEGCSSLKTLDVSTWNTSNVCGMSSMFEGCSSLRKLDVSNWDTSKVTSMRLMFKDCSSLEKLDMSQWNTSDVNDCFLMFYNCNSIKTIHVPAHLTTEMFLPEGIWNDEQGNSYGKFPQNLIDSIVLTKEEE